MEETERKTPGDATPEPASSREADAAGTPAPAAPAAGDAETPQTAAASPLSPRVEPTAEKVASSKPRALVPHLRLVLAIAGGTAALISAAIASLSVGGGARSPLPPATAASLAATLSGEEPSGDGGAPDAVADSAGDAAPAGPTVWRVAQLADDGGVSLVEVVVDRRPLLAALGSAHISRGEAARVTKSLAEVRDVDHFGAKNALTLALDNATKRVVAYELAESPSDVWQGLEESQSDGSLQLEAKKLRLQVERVRVGKAVVVGPDLRASFVEAGFAPIDDVLTMLEDALQGHAELADIRPGARLRVVATQERVDGVFVRWASLDAIEYFPAAPNAPSVRVYLFGPDEAGEESAARKKHRGWYDAKGRQPVHGGWRSPVPLARIASRFNPHRMHPVLHVVMPHNGIDFAAPVGAPVYATAAGVVVSMGNGGPCGNMVEISHPAGVTSVYCHLSRFAAGVHAGQHVEQRQLIAYVGQTGRVTGPHLHFGIKHNGVFVDPMTLRLDGVRVVPRELRDEFDRHRAVLDGQLDGIALPAPGGAVAESPAEPETFYEEP